MNIDSDELERPSGLTIDSPMPVTFASSATLVELSVHVLPPSEERTEPPAHAMTTSLPRALGHAEPHLAPAG